MLQKSKRLLSIFMIAISLVCCLSVFTACKKGKGSSDEPETGGETPGGSDSSGGSTPAQTITLTAAMLTLEYETVVFDRTAKEPTVIVKNGEATVETTEYSVSYSNNTNVGTATVTVSAKDDSNVLKGSATKDFTITIAELPEIEEIEVGIWTGESLVP